MTQATWEEENDYTSCQLSRAVYMSYNHPRNQSTQQAKVACMNEQPQEYVPALEERLLSELLALHLVQTARVLTKVFTY